MHDGELAACRLAGSVALLLDLRGEVPPTPRPLGGLRELLAADESAAEIIGATVDDSVCSERSIADELTALDGAPENPGPLAHQSPASTQLPPSPPPPSSLPPPGNARPIADRASPMSPRPDDSRSSVADRPDRSQDAVVGEGLGVVDRRVSAGLNRVPREVSAVDARRAARAGGRAWRPSRSGPVESSTAPGVALVQAKLERSGVGYR
jgi:hypothetical protein